MAVDRMLTRWLRPHQREGVAFMFQCVAGLRKFDGHGCILADDMGLGARPLRAWECPTCAQQGIVVPMPGLLNMLG